MTPPSRNDAAVARIASHTARGGRARRCVTTTYELCHHGSQNSRRPEKNRTKPRFRAEACAVWGRLGHAEAGVSSGRMARRLIVRMFADTVRYGEALELQARPFAFSRPDSRRPEVPTPRSLTSPSSPPPVPLDAQESIASTRRAGAVADTLLVLQVRRASPTLSSRAVPPPPRSDGSCGLADSEPPPLFRHSLNRNRIRLPNPSSTTTCSPSASVRTITTSLSTKPC